MNKETNASKEKTENAKKIASKNVVGKSAYESMEEFQGCNSKRNAKA